MAFNTLSYVKQLKQAGFTEQQAEVQAEALQQVLADNMATHDDMQSLNIEINTKIESLRTEMNTNFAKMDAKIATQTSELKADMVKWMFGLLTAQMAAIVSLLKFIH